MRLFKAKYEYKIIDSKRFLNLSQINRFGLDGWRLIAILHHDMYYHFYFEREI
jgi:hypothetical protein